jgi:hypothetical protein
MADSSIYSEIEKVILLLLGGLLAVGGGVITQFFTHRLTVKREQYNLRRERLEFFVKALYANQQWLEEGFTVMMFRKEDHYRPSPLDEAHAIQALFFPELSKEVSDVVAAQLPMLKHTQEQRLTRMKDPEAWLRGAWSEKPYVDALRVYADAVKVATTKCRQLLGS